MISSLSCRLDVAYGDSKNDTLDIFYHGSGPARTNFFHGAIGDLVINRGFVFWQEIVC